jgi:2-polyprenyl-3-methyl-5-hydroxy-6-metoxy-1,4-benzoquinol methylase
VTHEKDPERVEARRLHEYADFSGKRVLEVGCGDGRLTWRYADRAQRVAGIDLDREALRVAVIERSADMASVAAFAQADSTRLPFAGESYEIAIFAWSF